MENKIRFVILATEESCSTNDLYQCYKNGTEDIDFEHYDFTVPSELLGTIVNGESIDEIVCKSVLYYHGICHNTRIIHWFQV